MVWAGDGGSCSTSGSGGIAVEGCIVGVEKLVVSGVVRSSGSS